MIQSLKNNPIYVHMYVPAPPLCSSWKKAEPRGFHNLLLQFSKLKGLQEVKILKQKRIDRLKEEFRINQSSFSNKIY